MIKMFVGVYVFSVSILESPSSKALLNLLPLELNMTDLNANEKYFYLDAHLPASASKVQAINAGDIMLYENNCLVIFYKSFSTSYSYTKIGSISNTTNLIKALGTKNCIIKISK